MERFKKIDSLGLKLIAVIAMMLDHMCYTVIPGNMWMTWVGRIAFPIFAFLIVEGYFHTKNVKKYALRLLIFALISEVPFNLMVSGSVFFPFHQNPRHRNDFELCGEGTSLYCGWSSVSGRHEQSQYI